MIYWRKPGILRAFCSSPCGTGIPMSNGRADIESDKLGEGEYQHRRLFSGSLMECSSIHSHQEGLERIDCSFINNPIIRDIGLSWRCECIFQRVLAGATLETMKRKTVNARRNIPVMKPPSPAKIIITSATRTSIPPITRNIARFLS